MSFADDIYAAFGATPATTDPFAQPDWRHPGCYVSGAFYGTGHAPGPDGRPVRQNFVQFGDRSRLFGGALYPDHTRAVEGPTDQPALPYDRITCQSCEAVVWPRSTP